MVTIIANSSRVNAQSGATLRFDPVLTSSIEIEDTLEFSLVIDIPAGNNYGYGSFTIEYDSTILRLDSFAVGSNLIGAVNTNEAGLIRFNGISPSGETGSVVLGAGRFTAVSAGDVNLTIGIVDQPGEASGATLPEVISENGSVSVVEQSSPPIETSGQTLFLPIIANN